MSLFSSTQIVSINQRTILSAGLRLGTAQVLLSPGLCLGIILALVLALTAVSIAAVQLQPSPDKPGESLGDNHNQPQLVRNNPNLSADVTACGVTLETHHGSRA